MTSSTHTIGPSARSLRRTAARAGAVMVLAGAACAPDTQPTGEGIISVSQESIDFGRREIGSEASLELIFDNDGQRTIAFTHTQGSLLGTVFSVSFDRMNIPSGETTNVAVMFTPTWEIAYETHITFVNDSDNEPELEVLMRGTGYVFDSCRNVECNEPPLPLCVTGDMARRYEAPGECDTGICDYPSTDIPCDFGCDLASGECNPDPCDTTVCNQPPSVCFQGTGTCSAGACLYTADDTLPCDDGDPCSLDDHCAAGTCRGGSVRECTTPPADGCSSPTVLRRYDAAGYCLATGECHYDAREIPCEFGCVDAGCIDDPCAGGCNDSNPCTVDECVFGVGCQHTPNSLAPCVTSSGDCPQGVCSGTQCVPVYGVTCEAEYSAPLCPNEIVVAGYCTQAGQCEVDEPPPDLICPGCFGICITCFGVQLCLGL